MDLTAFETSLGEIAVLTRPQRRRALQALAGSEIAEGRDSEMRPRWIGRLWTLPRRRTDRGRRIGLHGQCGGAWAIPGGHRGLSPLRQPRCRGLRPGQRSAALPLQSLLVHVRRSDENAVGEFTHEGQMGGAVCIIRRRFAGATGFWRPWLAINPRR